MSEVGLRFEDLFPPGEPAERAKFPRRIVTTGGRKYADRAKVREVLAEYLPADPSIDEPSVQHGRCRTGADYLVHEEATDLGFWVGYFEADWDRYGRAAGPIRNRQLLDWNPDLVIAFPGGDGTADLVGEAKRRGIPVREVERLGPVQQRLEPTTDRPEAKP